MTTRICAARSVFSAQRGMAIPLVLWMVAALTLTLSGIVYLSRDSVNMTDLRLMEAQTYAISRGAAVLAVRDYQRRKAQQGQGDEQPEGARLSPSNRYQIGGAEVVAVIYPTNGFVSIGEQDPEVWIKLLSLVGGLDVNSAAVLAQSIVDAKLSGGSSGGSGGMSFSQIRNRELSFSSSGHIEALLGVPGMNRTVYDRIVNAVSPFGGGEFAEDAAPKSVKLVLAPERQEALMGQQEASKDFLSEGGYWCVEVTTRFSPSDAFRQRVWVNASHAGSEARLVRVEAPYQVAGKGKG